MDKEQVIALVCRTLQEKSPPDLVFQIVEDKVCQKGSWWYVQVSNNRNITYDYPLYETLSEVGIELMDNAGLNVMLIPVSQPGEAKSEQPVRPVLPTLKHPVRKDALVALVEEYLRANPAYSGFTLHVAEDRVWQNGSRWVVPVYASIAQPTYEMYMILSDVTIDIQDNENIEIEFVRIPQPTRLEQKVAA